MWNLDRKNIHLGNFHWINLNPKNVKRKFPNLNLKTFDGKPFEFHFKAENNFPKCVSCVAKHHQKAI